MSKAAGKTGMGPTVLVAIEQFFPEKERGIQDEISYGILPFGMKSFVSLMRYKPVRNWMIRETEKDLPGIWAGMICRKQYIDEKIRQTLDSMDMVVNLGAGFDTRSFRIPEFSRKPVFEVDQPGIIKQKSSRLSQLFQSLPSFLKLIAMDFDKENLEDSLKSHGYDLGSKTFFIMEAVTQYLTESGITATFQFLSQAAPGSQLVFTYIRKDFLEGRNMGGWDKAYQLYVLKEKLWLFGKDPEDWSAFLKAYGWTVLEDDSYGELADKYIAPLGRELASTPVERILYAVKE